MAEKINITIDGIGIEVAEGATLLEAARTAGVFIPTLCHNDLVEPFAACFVCAVELEGRPNLVPSCATRAVAGMAVTTDSARVRAARKTCIDLLVSDHIGDCLGPCMTACPAGIDIPGYIEHISKGEPEEALKLILRNMPFPGILGRVCTRPCEAACRRQLVDEPIAICQLKRYPADAVEEELLPPRAPATGKRIAVVGAGPSGLAAAYYLQIFGHQCVVFDAHEAAGGMLRYGIPSYRLPRDVIDREAAVVGKLGAELRFRKRLGEDFTLADLRDQYDAVFLGLGAQKASAMRVPGEETEGVLTGIGFLGEASRNESMPVGRRVMVVGGGNTAIDAARTAIRLGAEEVTLLYRRTRKEMPAWEEEIVAAEEEGVALEILAAPIRIEKNDDGSLKVTCIRMALGEPDASGRRRPMPVAGSEHVRTVDNAIAAIGQGVSAEMADGLQLSRWGSINIDPQTLQTSLEGVFSGGDCVTGADIAVTAVAAGRRAAISIDQYVRGEPVVGEPAPYNHTMGELQEVDPKVFEKFDAAKRVPMPHLDAAPRARTFAEVETGFDEEMAKEEARRCMKCGCRDAHECKLREYATRFDGDQKRFRGERRHYVIDESHPEIVHEASKCIQCGICVQFTEHVLKTSAMGFVNRGFKAGVRPALGRALATLDHEGLERIVDLCPTGALTRKSDPVATLNPEIKRPDRSN